MVVVVEAAVAVPNAALFSTHSLTHSDERPQPSKDMGRGMRNPGVSMNRRPDAKAWWPSFFVPMNVLDDSAPPSRVRLRIRVDLPDPVSPYT